MVVAVPDSNQPGLDSPVTRQAPVSTVQVATPDDQAHVFRPVTHPPHTFASYRPIPESALPRLVQRNCYVTERQHPIRYSPQPRPRASPNTYGGGYAPAPKATAPSGNLGRASGMGRGVTQAQRSEKKAEAPAAASPSPRQAADEAVPSEAASQRARQASQSKGELAGARHAYRPLPEPELPQPVTRDGYHDWGANLYLSNDDTMSLSSAQRVLYAIDRKLPVPPEHIRPHEFLNYFSFDAAPVAPGDDFSVLANIAPKPGAEGIYTLGLSVSGRDVTRETRRNAGLTLVIDRSGSMADEGRMDYLKQGLQRMTSELKGGDLVNVVLFDDSVCTPLENFVVGRDPMSLLERTIARVQPRGSTDLNAGLTHGYRLANSSFNDAFTNRVILISDAIANTGVTDPKIVSLITESYDNRRIRLSGVGVGRDFNDELLDRLTEKGKGAYVFLGSSAEVDAVFGSRFVSLIETVANDVHFRLHLPPSLRMNTFYGEESSVEKSDVQAIHYFAGTNQLFLSDVMAQNGSLNLRDGIMLSVEYEDPETGSSRVEEFAFTLSDINGASHNLDKGRMLMSFIDGVRDIELTQRERSRDSNYASQQCANGKSSLRDQAGLARRDPEIDRVLGLWDNYCNRYPSPRPLARLPQPDESGALRRQAPRGNDVWPGAR